MGRFTISLLLKTPPEKKTRMSVVNRRVLFRRARRRRGRENISGENCRGHNVEDKETTSGRRRRRRRARVDAFGRRFYFL